MQENHLKSNEEGYTDSHQDLLNASLLFARTLGIILKESEGMVIDVTGDVNFKDDTKKVIIFKLNDQIHIYKSEEDLPEGTVVKMDNNPADQQA